MRNLLFTLCFSAILTSGFAQKLNISSVTDGNWFSPLTWDCNCIPQPDYIININHKVTYNTGFAINGGTVTIGNTGALVKDNFYRTFIMTNGSFTNNGFFHIDRFASYAGTVTNNDSMQIESSLYNTGTINSNGIIFNTDSVLNSGILDIKSSGKIYAVNFLNTNKFYNDGVADITFFLNDGTFSTLGITVTGNFLNTGNSAIDGDVNVTNDFMNTGKTYVFSGMNFNVANDFLNNDSINSDAVFENDGSVTILSDFLNTDTLKGKGVYCIGGSSANSGVMTGTFDFCDISPLFPPQYVDNNTGVIDTTITSCTKTCTVGLNGYPPETAAVIVFPNPFTDKTSFTVNGPVADKAKISVFDIAGRNIFSAVFNNGSFTLNRENIENGMYFYTLETSSKVFSGKLIVE